MRSRVASIHALREAVTDGSSNGLFCNCDRCGGTSTSIGVVFTSEFDGAVGVAGEVISKFRPPVHLGNCEQPRNQRPSLFRCLRTSIPPHLEHVLSADSVTFRSPGQVGEAEQPRKIPPSLSRRFATNGCPHSGHFTPSPFIAHDSRGVQQLVRARKPSKDHPRDRGRACDRASCRRQTRGSPRNHSTRRCRLHSPQQTPPPNPRPPSHGFKNRTVGQPIPRER